MILFNRIQYNIIELRMFISTLKEKQGSCKDAEDSDFKVDYVCIYIYVHTHIHMYIYIHIHMFIYI